jgi:predicted aldo/keto reductase-like oxidoreductase
MEPLLGGRLSRPPQALRDIFDAFPVKRTPSDWALQWVWDQPEVAVVLSGMTSIGQVEENLESAERSGIHSLTAEEAGLIDRVRREYRDKVLIPCTNCGYCLPCPSGVNIPQNFELYNDGFIHDSPAYSRALYSRFLTTEQRANACTQCGVCLEKCPQNIAISDELAKVNAVLGEGRPYEKK